jgi:preprotein translocase subunit YajC
VVHIPVVLAQLAPGGSNPVSFVLMIGALFAVMYFVMIRPQQKQQKEHRELLSALKKGDDVVTQGGLFGKIHAVTDKIVTLEIANGVRIRVLKSSIQGKTALTEEPSTSKPEEKERKEEKP